MKKSQKIDTVSLIIVSGFSLAVIYHYILGVYYRLPYPYNTFLFLPDDKFMDFFNMLASPYVNGKLYITQFPFGQRLAQAFTILPSRIAFIVFITIFVSFFLYVNYSNLSTPEKDKSLINVFVFTFMSYPFLFIVDRANIEVFVFIFLYLFVSFYRKQRTIISLIFLSLAISMKLFPAVFLVLLLSDKKYKETAYAVLFVIVITISGYLSYDGLLHQNLRDHLNSLGIYNNNYAIGNAGLYFGNSIWGLIKSIAIALDMNFISPLLSRIHVFVVIILFGLIVLYVLFIEKVTWKKVLLLVLSMNLFPYVSADYKLIHIFIPLFLFINTDTADRSDYLYTILFGLLIIPKAYYHYPSNPEITSSLIINPLLMIMFVSVIAWDGLREWSGKNQEASIKLKKISVSVVMTSILLALTMLTLVIWTVLSPMGNEIIRTRLTAYLSNKYNASVVISALKISTDNISIDMDIKNIVTLNIELSMEKNRIFGKYVLNVVDASKLKSRFGEGAGLSTHGFITGSGINDFQIDGEADMLEGSGNYHIELTKRKISRIALELKKLRTDEALRSFRKNGDGLVGTMDINCDVTLENRKPKTGYIKISGEKLSVKDPSIISEFSGLLLPKDSKLDVMVNSDIKNSEMISNIDVRPNDSRITMDNNRYNFITKKIGGNYIAYIYNKKDFDIGKNAKYEIVRKNLHCIKSIKTTVDKIYRGKVIVAGNIIKDAERLEINGAIIDATGIKNNGARNPIFPFSVQDAILSCPACN